LASEARFARSSLVGRLQRTVAEPSTKSLVTGALCQAKTADRPVVDVLSSRAQKTAVWRVGSTRGSRAALLRAAYAGGVLRYPKFATTVIGAYSSRTGLSRSTVFSPLASSPWLRWPMLNSAQARRPYSITQCGRRARNHRAGTRNRSAFHRRRHARRDERPPARRRGPAPAAWNEVLFMRANEGLPTRSRPSRQAGPWLFPTHSGSALHLRSNSLESFRTSLCHLTVCRFVSWKCRPAGFYQIFMLLVG
jgi:hypothetical protein